MSKLTETKDKKRTRELWISRYLVPRSRFPNLSHVLNKNILNALKDVSSSIKLVAMQGGDDHPRLIIFVSENETQLQQVILSTLQKYVYDASIDDFVVKLTNIDFSNIQ